MDNHINKNSITSHHHHPVSTESVKLKDNLQVEINYQQGTIKVGDATYLVRFGGNTLQEDQKENIMKIVEAALSQVGQDLDQASLETIRINKKTINYKAAGSTSLEQNDKADKIVAWDKKVLDINMKSIFTHVFTPSKKIHHEKETLKNPPKKKQDLPRREEISKQTNITLQNVTTKPPEKTKKKELSIDSNPQKNNLTIKKAEVLKKTKTKNQSVEISAEDLKKECLKELPNANNEKLDLIIENYQKEGPSHKSHLEWFDTRLINNVMARLVDQYDFHPIVIPTTNENRVVLAGSNNIENLLFGTVNNYNDNKPIAFTLTIASHFVVVYVDRRKKTVEYYDSKGDYADKNSKIKEQLKLLTRKLSSESETYSFVDRAAEIKEQGALQEDGYACGSWSCYFIENRLKNPNFDPSSIDRDTKEDEIREYRLKDIHAKNIIKLYRDESMN